MNVIDKRRDYFKDHIAVIENYGDIVKMMWRNKDNHWHMHINFIFDGKTMFIDGDLGTAVYRLTWLGSPYSNWEDISLEYFTEKLSAYHSDRYLFNDEIAIKTIKEYIEHNEIEMTSLIKYFIDSIPGEREVHFWHSYIYENANIAEEIDLDYWEWMYDCGNEIPRRQELYLLALQMAKEYLTKNELGEEI